MNQVFSEFELKRQGFKFDGEQQYKSVNCVGSSEEILNAKTITKKCRGVVVKTVVKGDGTGTLKLAAHVPYDVYEAMYGMEIKSLIDGVKAYGQNSRHKPFSVVQDVYDEDGNEKLKAYPNCIMTSGVSRKIENGVEEIAELELEISIMPDEFGNGMYETLVSELQDDNIVDTWMTAFTPELVQVETV